MDESLTQRNHVEDEGFSCKLLSFLKINKIEERKALAKMRASSRGKTCRASALRID